MEPAALTRQVRASQTRVMMQLGTVLQKQHQPFVHAELPSRLAELLREFDEIAGTPTKSDQR